MSKYTSKEQLNHITQSISKMFDIKLSNVRHKVSLHEGYKCHEAHIASLPSDVYETEFHVKHIADGTKTDDETNCVQILGRLNMVRLHPTMYMGGDVNNLFNIAFDVFISNFKSKKCTQINIDLSSNLSFSISDNSTGLFPDFFVSSNEKPSIFQGGELSCPASYHRNIIPVSFNGIGDLYILNALSSSSTIRYNNSTLDYNLAYKNGKQILETVMGYTHGNPNEYGLYTAFTIDREIPLFKNQSFDIDAIYDKIKLASILNPGLKIIIKKSDTISEILHNTDSSFPLFSKHYRELNLDDCQTICKTDESSRVDLCVGLFETDDGSEFSCFSYINDHFTPDGGTHVKGLISALNEFPYKEFLPDNLIGVKAVLMVNAPSYTLTQNNRQLKSSYFTQIIKSLLIE